VKGKGWVVCPKCRRRIFRWRKDGIETAQGVKIDGT